MRDKVARLRQLLSEAVPVDQGKTQSQAEAWRMFQGFDSLACPSAPMNRRAKTIREINRIAAWYGWGSEIQRALDAADAESLAALDDQLLEGLRLRLQNLEDCVQAGMGPPDAPPAS